MPTKSDHHRKGRVAKGRPLLVKKKMGKHHRFDAVVSTRGGWHLGDGASVDGVRV